MWDNNSTIKVTKASGIRVPFNKNKLKQSLLRSGASGQQAEDIANENGKLLVYTPPEKLHQVVAAVRSGGFNIIEAELTYKPKAEKVIEDKPQREKIVNFLAELDELEDVQGIFLDVKL